METTTQPLALLKFSKTREGKPVLSVTRRDGSVAWQKQGDFFPLHDLTHYAIETALGLRHAFWGMMADGWDFADFGSPWPRGPIPDPAEAVLAEAMAGCFGLFARATDDDEEGAAVLNEHLAEYCCLNDRPLFRAITASEFGRIRRVLADLQARWTALGPRDALELEFNVD